MGQNKTLIEKISRLDRILLPIAKQFGCEEKKSLLCYLIGLLPIPILQQGAQVAHKMLETQDIQKKFSDLWDNLHKTNEKLEKLESLDKFVVEVANTSKYVSNINQEVNDLISDIKNICENQSFWSIETENWSYQKMVNSIVQTDEAIILSNNNSTNEILNTTIESNRTRLIAQNESYNRFDKMNFTTPNNNGSVSMNGVTNKGRVDIGEGSVTIYEGSSLIIGGSPPNTSTVNCSVCRNKFLINNTDSYTICPYCSNRLLIHRQC